MNCSLKISNEKGRTLVKMKGDRIIVARFPDMNDKEKEIITEFYTELTGEEPFRIREFLDYKNEELEFCS